MARTAPNETDFEDTQERTGKRIVMFFLILIIVGIAIGCFFSPVFNLAKIVIDDGIHVSKEEIQNIVDAQIGENVFQIEYGALENQIEELPYIQSAQVQLKMPNTIEIKYVERVPFALVKYLESFLVMDQYGYILEVTREKKFEGLPIIYNVEFNSYEVGKRLTDTAKTKYDNVVYLLENAKQNHFDYTISEINYESIGNVKIWVTEEDVEIVYGEINRNTISDKLKYIAGILSKVKGKKGRIDVSSSNYLEKTVFTERY